MKKKSIIKKMCLTALATVVMLGALVAEQPVESKASLFNTDTASSGQEDTELNIRRTKAGVGVKKSNRIELKLNNAGSDVTWSIRKGDESRVKLVPQDNGTAWAYVTNYGDGSIAGVTAKVGSSSYVCDITPKKPSATKPFLSYTSYNGYVGNKLQLKVYNYDGKITWKRSNTRVTVSKSGVVTFKKAGSVKVTAVLENGKELVCSFKLAAKPELTVTFTNNGYTNKHINGKTITEVREWLEEVENIEVKDAKYLEDEVWYYFEHPSKERIYCGWMCVELNNENADYTAFNEWRKVLDKQLGSKSKDTSVSNYKVEMARQWSAEVIRSANNSFTEFVTYAESHNFVIENVRIGSNGKYYFDYKEPVYGVGGACWFDLCNWKADDPDWPCLDEVLARFGMSFEH